MKRDILEKLKNLFDEEKLPAIIRNKGEDELPMDMLSVLLTDFGDEAIEAMAEFFFLPLPEDEDDNFMSFQAIITLAEYVDPAISEKLALAMSYLNFRIPFGWFCMDSTGDNLVYKGSVNVPSDVDLNVAYSIIELNVINFLNIAAGYADVILKVAAGIMEPDEIAEL